MERKSILVAGSLLIITIVLCLNWYVGLNSYVLEEDIFIEKDLSYAEALEKGKEYKFDVDVDHIYYSQERVIVANKKTLIPLVFEKDTLFSSGVSYFKRNK